MKLSLLLQGLSQKQLHDGRDADITGLAYDSRLVEHGFLFVAVPGFHVDGHKFIFQAIDRGAAAIVAESQRLADIGLSTNGISIPLITVVDSRRALAELAAAFYGYPSRKLRIIGITGTDGKTTTSYLVNAILERAGYKTGLLGTVDFKIGERVWANNTRQTTPEAPEVQQLLAEMVKEKVDYAIIESTSHGLALERVTTCGYDVAIFTNLTSDHLDFHKTREQYLRDKAKLFALLGESHDKGIPKVAVLNRDEDSYDFLRHLCKDMVVEYGLENNAAVMAKEIRLSESGTDFVAVTPVGEIDISLRLPAQFNVYNALAAIAAGISQEVGLPTIKAALESVAGVPGRMERIDCGQPFTVIVDYAHTPDSLEKMLKVLRPLTRSRLIVVFGCAGERDRARRSGMGNVAGRLADFSILTNEDPRFEDPMSILDEIGTGIEACGGKFGKDYIKIVDRREAIHKAFEIASEGDVILLTGKGHEQCIIVGNEKQPWDDRRVAREELTGLFGHSKEMGKSVSPRKRQ